MASLYDVGLINEIAPQESPDGLSISRSRWVKCPSGPYCYDCNADMM
jgi:hypothetical protein